MQEYKPWHLELGCLIGTVILIAGMTVLFFAGVIIDWVRYQAWDLIFRAWDLIT